MDGCGMIGGRFAYSLLPKLDKNVPVNVDKFKCDSQLSQVNIKLQEFYRHQQFCDVTLVAGMDGVKVEAHRVILASSSDYFCAMFGGSLSESRSKEVYLDQIDGVTLQAIVDFMYFGTLEIRRDNVENILTASSLFNLEKVAERGSQFMINHLDSSNCLGIALYAEQYNYFLLYRHAYAKVCDCFTELPEEDEFHMLNVEQFSKFLKSDDLCVESEEDVFRVVIKWIEHDREDRQQYIARLFGLVRFYRLSPSFIDSEVIPVYNANDCLDVIAKSRKQRYQSKYSRNRNPKKKLTYISVWFTDENVLSAEVYNPVLNCWKYQEWPEKPNNRSVFKTAILGNELIFAGGRTEYFCPSNIVDALDVKTMKWRELPSMLSPRHLFALVALDGKLYAVGGRGDDGVLQSVERYDPETNQWEYVASTLERHSEHAAVALNGKLYVLGGSHSFECYNPETDTWCRKAPMKSSASPATMAVVNDTLFAISSQDCKLQRYEATTNVWVDISTLGGNIKNIECCGYGDTLIISVGNSLVMSYNILTEVWSTLPPYERLCGKGVLVSI